MNIDCDGVLQLQPHQLISQRIAVLGISGSGKTNTADVLAEELLPLVPFTMIDIEGEMFGLKSDYNLLVAGRSKHIDLEINANNAGHLASALWPLRQSVILDISDMDKHEQDAVLLSYFAALWKSADADNAPHMLLIEEAHEFMPENGRGELHDLLIRFAKRGRKRGVGMIAVSQRSASLDKNFLTQAGVSFLHRVVHPADFAVYKGLIPLPPREVERMVSTLKPGQAVVMIDGSPHIAQIRQQQSFHAGATPTGIGSAPQLIEVDAALIERLRDALNTDAPRETGTSRESNYRAEIERLNAEVNRLTEERDLNAARLSDIETENNVLRNELAEKKHSSPQPFTVDETDQPYRSSLATERGIKKQERSFASLLSDIGKLSQLDQLILRYCIERENQKFTTREIARFIGYSESTLDRRPPLWLVERGYLKRETNTNKKARYWSSIHDKLEYDYPDLDAEDLINHLLNMLPK